MRLSNLVTEENFLELGSQLIASSAGASVLGAACFGAIGAVIGAILGILLVLRIASQRANP